MVVAFSNSVTITATDTGEGPEAAPKACVLAKGLADKPIMFLLMYLKDAEWRDLSVS